MQILEPLTANTVPTMEQALVLSMLLKWRVGELR
jgi:hypothetical protein